MADINMTGSIWNWSSSGGLKVDAYVLSLFKNRFIRLKSLTYQDFSKFIGLFSKV